MQLREDLSKFEDCTSEEKEKVIGYLQDLGLYLGEQSYFTNL
jgi:hypothetical protein